jgi:hypothetical protein
MIKPMSMFNTLVAKYLFENSEFELSNLTNFEAEFVDVLAKTFTDLYNKNKDRIFKTVQAKRSTILLTTDRAHKPPIVVIDFRREFDNVLRRQIKDLIQKTTNQAWNQGTNAEFNTYLNNTFISFIDATYFYLDPESPEDLCISIVDTKQLLDRTNYGAAIPDDMFSKRVSIYYPAYIESTIQKAFTACFLYNIKITMKFATLRTIVPYFKERTKLLLKSLAGHHAGHEDLLDY